MSLRLPLLLGAAVLLAVSFGFPPQAAGHGGGLADEEQARVPNNGAVIHIVSPSDGSVYQADTDIDLRIQLEHFALGQDGNHWHISVDGEPWIMVEDGSLKQTLRSLLPGEHTVEVIMADGEHRDLEEGDAVRIVVR